MWEGMAHTQQAVLGQPVQNAGSAAARHELLYTVVIIVSAG